MVKIIIEKEVLEILRSPKFVVTFTVCVILNLLSFYVGAQDYHHGRTRWEAARAANLRQMEGLTNWLELNWNRIFLPPQPLASLVTGISNDIGTTINMQGRGELSTHGSRFNEDPIYAVFRFLDLEFLFQVILSLFAILLTYDAISGEKERGTLRLAFANPLSRVGFILGKLGGAFLALSIPLLLALALGCLLLIMLNVPLSGQDWIKLILIILTGMLYFTVFLTMTIFFSALTGKSSNSFLLALLAWIAAVFIIPRASVLIAGRAVEVPSLDYISAQKASYRTQLWEEDREAFNTFRAPETKDMQRIMDALSKFMDSIHAARESKLMELARQLNEDRNNRLNIQQNVALNLARISPAGALSLAVTSLAGTSLNLKEHFLSEAIAYQAIYGDFVREKTGWTPGGMVIYSRTEVDENRKAIEPEAIDPTEMPAFEYRPQTISAALQPALLDQGLLIFFILLFFVGSFAAFMKYDLR